MNSENRKEGEQNFSEKEQAKSATDEGCDKLREKLAKLEEENAELKDKNLRLAAEFENFRKRQEKIFAELLAQERDNIISKLLSIADDVSRALKAAQEGAKPDTIVEGVKIIANKINELLKLE
ncbi:nucleotide exchange factor GrpE, partial [bacterium]